ncbi:MAG: cell division protein ZapA [Desulfuromonadaceae bacterium]|nr:cell division protein ZapA [Desulfuromonadaceae bacterium]MDD2847730.1 cell division protein ZapA [Desulfuromonadaceae bacterium]MDD4131024.1 cell division protein ZapA [Desulfuromonadaceae bacterium]
MKTSHAVTILGRELSVRSSAPEAKVKAVEAFVNGKLHDIGGVLRNGDAQLILTLALLNTAEELLELRSQREQDAGIDSRISTIIAALETV